MQASPLFLGVDVSKDELVIARYGVIEQENVRNDVSSIRCWLKTLPADTVIGMESTGRYHQLLATLAASEGFATYILNAKDVYFYAKALGTRGKTDRVDAQVIARFLWLRHEQLYAYQLPSATQASLQQLQRQRHALVVHKGALKAALTGAHADVGPAVAELEQSFAQALRA